MNVAIIGATGSCGRQVAAQLLARRVLSPDARLHLIGHAGGAHATELWGLRADLADAFADDAPTIEVGTDVTRSDANLVVMMAGATVTRDTKDRAALAATNRRIFAEAADALGTMRDVTVVVQSNPVELALQLFAAAVPRHRLLGAAAWSDSLRFRRELAAELGVQRTQLQAQMWGQHGDHLVPIWSRVHARGVSAQHLADVIGRIRNGRSLLDLAHEISEARGRALKLVESGDVAAAYAYIQSCPPDVRAAVKPFFTHFTAGHTTELATAHAVVDVVAFIARGTPVAIPAQVMLEEGEAAGFQAGPLGGPLSGPLGGPLSGPLAVPVLTDPLGWSQIIDEPIADDEAAALKAAAAAIAAANAAA